MYNQQWHAVVVDECEIRSSCVHMFNVHVVWLCCCCVFCFQAEDGIRDLVRSRGLGDVYKRQGVDLVSMGVSMSIKPLASRNLRTSMVTL